MYKRHNGQISMFDTPEFFGTIPLNPKNEWVKLSKLIPWDAFEIRYAESFKSVTGQPAYPSRIALGSILIKQRYRLSDDDTIAEITMNPYLQFFLGFEKFRYDPPFSSCMMTRFRQRITPDMLAWINDVITGRPVAGDGDDHDHNSNGNDGDGCSNRDDSNGTEHQTNDSEPAEKNATVAEEPANEGTLILDATCAPQSIRFPTDVSLLNEARMQAEKIIDLLHAKGFTDHKKPRTYRVKARNAYNSFSKSRKKTGKSIRKALKSQLCYLGRDLHAIYAIEKSHPDCLRQALPTQLYERFQVVQMLYAQQSEMYEKHINRIDNRIVSLSQPWVRPIVRGKQNAPVEFGAKVEMSVVNGYLRVEALCWDAYNESKTLQDSVENYRKAYGHYPQRVLADTIFRTRENLRFCKDHQIHMNGPKLGKPATDPVLYRKQLREEWLESGERGEIERQFGTAKRRYSLGSIAMKLKHTSEVDIYAAVLAMNIWKRLRLLFANFFRRWFGDAFGFDDTALEPALTTLA